MAASLLLALLVVSARAACLPNASLPADRKHLFNPLTGGSYPIGLWENGNYPAAKLSTQVLQIVIQEMLNYRVEVKGTSPLGVDSFFALMGCRTPSNGINRGCGSGRPTEVHICVEVWTTGYQAEWNRIQIESPTVAPKLLGNMGYNGVSGQYIPLATQQKAYNAEGLNLDFYREYNTSWRNPARYFSSPGELDVSKLLPCKESGMMSSEIMATYVEMTGDYDGVTIHDSRTVVAKCFDDYFWYAPACRADPTTCLTWLTGGNGWGLLEIMPKAATFNMPLATAIASSFGNYATLPQKDLNLMLFWWTPDPTFLRLEPVKIMFPSYDPEAWDQGDRRTEAKDVSIDKLASRDLKSLAPEVEEFLNRFRLSLSDINSMMLNQMDTADDDFDVACRWLLSSEKWTSWIPEQGKCFPQFGMYDEDDGAFLSAREAVTISCKVCPSGTYSAPYEDDEGPTYICKPCAAGTFQPSGAAESCNLCPAGSYQDATGSVACHRCAVGEYQDQEGQRSCKRCPDGATTLLLGSDSISDCGCEAGSISVGSTALECIRCGEGMDCPFSSSLSSLQSGQPSSEQQAVAAPAVQRGYFASVDDPLQLFRCRPAEWCPGGQPGRCAGGLHGVPCALCPDGTTWAAGEAGEAGEAGACADCGPVAVAWVLAGPVALVTSGALYFVVNQPVTAQATPLKTAQMAGGLVISTLQIFALLGLTSAKWPATFAEVSSDLQVFVLDLDNLRIGCVLGSSPLVSYEFTALTCPVMVVWILFCYASTKTTLVQRCGLKRWRMPYAFNTIGFGLQLGFGTIAAVALKPMMCYQHPNGRYSVLSYPSVFCWEEGHGGMLACGILLLVVVVVGFPVACSYATWKLPYWSVTGNHAMVQCFRFCTSNFQLSCYSFVLLVLFRGLGFAVAIAVGTNYPPVQKALVSLILVIYSTLLAKMQPWKVPVINLADSLVSGSLLLLACSSIETDREMEAEFAEYFTVLILVLVITCLSVVVLMSMLAIVLNFFGKRSWTRLLNLDGSRDYQQISEALQDCAQVLMEIQSEHLCEKIQTMNYYDVKTILNLISVFEVDLLESSKAPGFSGCGSKPLSPQSFTSGRRVALKALNSRLVPGVEPWSDSFSEVVTSNGGDESTAGDDSRRCRRLAGPSALQSLEENIEQDLEASVPGEVVAENPRHREPSPIAEEDMDFQQNEINQTLSSSSGLDSCGDRRSPILE